MGSRTRNREDALDFERRWMDWQGIDEMENMHTKPTQRKEKEEIDYEVERARLSVCLKKAGRRTKKGV